MPESAPNIGPVSDKKADDLFELWLILEEIFSPYAAAKWGGMNEDGPSSD